MTMTRSRWLAAAGVLLLLLLIVGFAHWETLREQDVAGGVPVQIPEARRWWTRAALCLGDESPYPEGTTFYTGTQVPYFLVSSGDLPTLKEDAAYTLNGRRVIFLPGVVQDSGLVVHELWHVVHGFSHPRRVFGDTATAPECGLSPPASSLVHGRALWMNR